MYLRSQDILHVIFVLNGGGPVHLDLLLGLLLGLGFSKLYPKRHDALLCVCVLVTCNILVSSVCLLTSLSQTRPHWLYGWLPLASCARNWARLTALTALSVLLRARALLLTLRDRTFHWSSAQATGWHSHCPGPHPHIGGGVLCRDIYIWKYDP